MITAIYDPGTDNHARKVSDFDEVRQIIAQGEGTLWLHISGVEDNEHEQILANLFGFHPLAIEDTLSHGHQAPKIDEFKDHIFIIVHALAVNTELVNISTTELNCFLGKNYLVTSTHDYAIAPVEAVWERVVRDERLLDRGADFLLHRLLDAVVDDFVPFIDRIDDELDALETDIIENPRQTALKQILELKHCILAIRRIISPQREVLVRLARGEFDLISEQSEIYFRDVYDHLVRIQDLTEGMRDIVGGTLDTYMSVSANKLNEVMKTLTIMSTIFMPLTLITGLYGMNFEFMPELHWRYGYLMVWVIILLLAVGMLWFFRRKKWL